ncbi:hypothetical protein D029_3378 [Vibrio parahaemolyticus 970107]|nr:hypothetical protein D029_3378 [Vibrio parahaemolyticus 970107]
MLKCHAAAYVLRASPLNWALVCKKKNEAISQDLAVQVQRQSCGFGYQVQR